MYMRPLSGEKVRQYRLDKGLTRRQLAKETHSSCWTIWRIENGMFANDDMKIALSRELGIDVLEWFYDLDVYRGELSVLGVSQEDIDEWIDDLREQERLRLERNF